MARQRVLLRMLAAKPLLLLLLLLLALLAVTTSLLLIIRDLKQQHLPPTEIFEVGGKRKVFESFGRKPLLSFLFPSFKLTHQGPKIR